MIYMIYSHNSKGVPLQDKLNKIINKKRILKMMVYNNTAFWNGKDTNRTFNKRF